MERGKKDAFMGGRKKFNSTKDRRNSWIKNEGGGNERKAAIKNKMGSGEFYLFFLFPKISSIFNPNITYENSMMKIIFKKEGI
jgi:hypothetical protein